MPYIGWCVDTGEGSAALRKTKLAEHLRYIEQHAEKILVAGPVSNEQAAMTGSLFVYNTDDKQEAKQLLEEDPYYQAGIWQSTELASFTAAAGVWCGGLSWKK